MLRKRIVEIKDVHREKNLISFAVKTSAIPKKCRFLGGLSLSCKGETPLVQRVNFRLPFETLFPFGTPSHVEPLIGSGLRRLMKR